MEKQTLDVQTRVLTGRKTKQLHAEGIVPAVMYGFETEPVMIQVDRNVFIKALRLAGESTVIELTLDGTVHPVLIQDIQYDSLTDFVTHIDFRRLNMNEKVDALIILTLEGEAPAVKELGGTLIQSLDELEVRSLPDALVREITVSVGGLATFEDTLRVSDLTIPEGIEVLTDAGRAIATVQPPRTEEEMEGLDEAVENNVEGEEVGEEKKEGGEGEGEEKKDEKESKE
jgi:large subunit ribosomal protein L25